MTTVINYILGPADPRLTYIYALVFNTVDFRPLHQILQENIIWLLRQREPYVEGEVNRNHIRYETDWVSEKNMFNWKAIAKHVARQQSAQVILDGRPHVLV